MPRSSGDSSLCALHRQRLCGWPNANYRQTGSLVRKPRCQAAVAVIAGSVAAWAISLVSSEQQELLRLIETLAEETADA
jgi:hypothetical protein